jgi:tetratricopeptide (TPR) repeat protein
MTEEFKMEYKQDGIVPFWKKLPFFFLFPFRFGPAVFLACLVAVSAVAGLMLGGFGFAFKGFLVYLGLRYAFNVLELFSQGRFEGESVDYTLWGPEKRPAKLGLVILLFVVIGVVVGGSQVASRIATNSGVQEQLLARYKQDHAVEIAEQEKEMQEYNARKAARAKAALSARHTPQPINPDDDTTESDRDVKTAEALSEPDFEDPPVAGLSREEILAQSVPAAFSPLWFKIQPAWFWVLMLLLSFILPSAAIVIALEDKFFKALNPLHVLDLIKSMGRAYFALWALFLIIAGTRHAALSLGESWPAAIRFPVEMGVATYLGLVLFAMMGYALYQYHQELGLDVDVDFDSHRKAGGAEGIAAAGSAGAALRAKEPTDPLERKVQALLAQGKVAEAVAEVKDNMRYDRYDPALNTRLHGLYVQAGDKAVTLTHGQQWLTGLTRAGKSAEALSALRALLAIDPTFAVTDGDAILPIAEAAFKKGEHKIAMPLVQGFDKRHPKHKDMAGIFFIAAKLASEHLGQQDNAVKILRALLKHFPDAAVATEAKTYLAVLEKLLTKA